MKRVKLCRVTITICNYVCLAITKPLAHGEGAQDHMVTDFTGLKWVSEPVSEWVLLPNAAVY